MFSVVPLCILSKHFRTECCRDQDAGSSASALLLKARTLVTRDDKIRLALTCHAQEKGTVGVICLKGRHQLAQHDCSLQVVDHGAHQVGRRMALSLG